MKYTVGDGVVRFHAGSDFDPKKIFECGQCFRWESLGRDSYQGVALGRLLKVWRDGDDICVNATAEQFESIWREYFDLDLDYARVRERVSIDGYMKRACDYGAGIRILRQDGWEALCSFIISQCNNIPRIKGIVERLCAFAGEGKYQDGQEFFAFPSAGAVARLDEQELRVIRAGFRTPYIIDAARKVDSGELDLEKLARAATQEALAALKGVKGVGDKVAGCVMLFGMHHTQAFPVDVWMKRAISEHYGGKLSPDVFGPYAGIAQQYMFYYARSSPQIA